MQANDSKNGDLEVEYTGKPLSGWGGTVAFFRFIERLGAYEYLKAGLPDGRTSPNQVKPVDMVKGFLCSVVSGARRFAHVDRVREDAVLGKILKAGRLPSADTLRRYLSGFTEAQRDRLSEVLGQLSGTLLATEFTSDILDLDSTVISRFGMQEGSTRGYQPVHHGRRSHHPYLAMFAKSKSIFHSRLRPGSAATQNGSVAFFEEIFARLPAGFKIELLRADSGFLSVAFLEALEQKEVPYLIAMSKTSSLLGQIAGITTWVKATDERQEIGELRYHPSHWHSPRRVIAVRRPVAPSATDQLTLVKVTKYEYAALVTNSETMTLQDAVDSYRGRGDCENRIKELKYDYNVTGFCLQSFTGTDVAFRLICFLHNLVSVFRRSILLDQTLTLATIRNSIFVVGAQIGSSGRKQILRLGLIQPWREAYQLLLDRIDAAPISTAAQFAKYLTSDAYRVPTPWKKRTPNLVPA
jgi:hypothetical protein